MDNTQYTLTPPEKLRTEVRLPASKSISGRALITYALTRPDSISREALHAAIKNLSDCDDTQVMIAALADMPEVIDIKAAGTAMRFLTAYLCVTPGTYTITGTERMRHRPIGILVDALRTLGADIDYVGETGFPPLRITGKTLEGGTISLPADVSSQYISALLIIGPVLRNGLTLNLIGNVASRPYINMTLALMTHFGAHACWISPTSLHVDAGSYTPKTYFVEGDWSAASYWYEMVALTRDENAKVDLLGLRHDSIQGDSKVQEMFKELGVETHYYIMPDETEVVRLSKGGGITCHFAQDFTHVPDLAQTLAVTCAMLDVPFHLYGLQSLRIKETDRISALKKELSDLVRLEERDSELLWEGISNIEDLDMLPYETFRFDTYEDHRMAMSLAPVCLRTGGRVQINDPGVVSKSYPTYWDDLRKAGFKVWEK